MHAGGDVRLDEGSSIRRPYTSGHLLYQQPALRPENALQHCCEAGVHLVADVLSHLDGCDRLVLTALDVGVVTHLDVDQIFKATLAHTGEDGVALQTGEGHGRYLDLVVFGHVQGECTPTAADVEQPRSWP